MMCRVINCTVMTLLASFFMLNSAILYAADFIELTVDPSTSSGIDADQVTLLINRSNIAHVEVNVTKTPERSWYKMAFYTATAPANKKDAILFILECSSTEAVRAISSAMRNGDKNPVNAVESCRLTDQ